MLRIEGDGGNGVALFQLEQFEVVSSRLSPAWIIAWNSAGVFELTVDEWLQPGFWERYYERDSNAVDSFEKARQSIVEADP
jgi:hypothetical protein